MNTKEMALHIASCVVDGEYQEAASLWKKYTTGMYSREIAKLRDEVKEIEAKLVDGFNQTLESDTGEL